VFEVVEDWVAAETAQLLCVAASSLATTAVFATCVGSAGSPIPYSSLRSYCKKDPASSWGAYVVGCLLVLAREKGVAYPDGISILVCSDVPEGEWGLGLGV
jgi:galactokinase